jgi:hypothetical protein
MYEHRVRLANGTTTTYARNLPDHDKALAQRHQEEIEKARVDRKRTFLRVPEIPGQPTTNVYQMRLSNGDVAVFSRSSTAEFSAQ